MNLKPNPLSSILSKKSFHPIINFDPDKKLIWLDFTSSNDLLRTNNIIDTQVFTYIVFNKMLNNNIGIGGYAEDRVIYRRSSHYQGQEPRSIHLGIDIWISSFTPVYCPMKSKLHSFRDNQGFGNYGPTIILEHKIEELTFYTLYGHLSRSSLTRLKRGQIFKAGEKIAEIGNFPENGDWPPHLHFQIISSMKGYEGDFPGVAASSEAQKFLENCPDPNLILQLPL